MPTANKKKSSRGFFHFLVMIFYLVGTIYPNIFSPIIEMISVMMKNRRQKEAGS